MTYEKIKILIGQAKTEQAITEFSNSAFSKNIEISNELLAIKAKFNENARKKRLGIIAGGEARMVDANIVVSLLELLELAHTNFNEKGDFEKKTFNPKKVKIFISYSHKDENIKEHIDIHLASLKRSDRVEVWNDRKIGIGSEWDDTIKKELELSDLILLIVSADFIASDYIWQVEIKKAIERHRKGLAVVIPIFARPCDFSEMPFAKLQGLPKDAKPISTFLNTDEAYSEISKAIKEFINKYH